MRYVLQVNLADFSPHEWVDYSYPHHGVGTALEEFANYIKRPNPKTGDQVRIYDTTNHKVLIEAVNTAKGWII